MLLRYVFVFKVFVSIVEQGSQLKLELNKSYVDLIVCVSPMNYQSTRNEQKSESRFTLPEHPSS